MENKNIIESDRINLKISILTMKLIVFRKLLDKYLNAKSHKVVMSSSSKKRMKIISDSLSNTNCGNLNTLNRVSETIKPNIFIVVNIDIENFKFINFFTYYDNKNNKEIVNENKIKPVLKKINEVVKKDIKQLIDELQTVEVKPNYFLQEFEIYHEDFYGYYDFDWIKVDFGAHRETYGNNKVIRCAIKYYTIYCPSSLFLLPTFDTIKLHKKMTMALIQFLLRTKITEDIRDGKYYTYSEGTQNKSMWMNMDHVGKYYDFNRADNIIIELGREERCKLGIPSDTKQIIDVFYSLDENKQEQFILSCYAYCNGLLKNPVEAITYFIIAIENIGTIESKSNSQISKENIIKNILKIVYKPGKELDEFVEYYYTIRSRYVHQGIGNNKIKLEFFEGFDVNWEDAINLEKVTYRIMIQWIINQKADKLLNKNLDFENVIFNKGNILAGFPVEKNSKCVSNINDGKPMCCDCFSGFEDIIIQRIGKYTLTGEEDWFYDEKIKCYYFYCSNKYFIDFPIGGMEDNMICTHFRWTNEKRQPVYGEFLGGEKNEIKFNYDYGIGGIENFKNWLRSRLKDGSVELYYVLKYPICRYNNTNKLFGYFRYGNFTAIGDSVKPYIDCSS